MEIKMPKEVSYVEKRDLELESPVTILREDITENAKDPFISGSIYGCAKHASLKIKKNSWHSITSWQ